MIRDGAGRDDLPLDTCACGREASEAIGDPLLDHEATCVVYLLARVEALEGTLGKIAESDWQENDPDGGGIEVPKMKPWDMWELAKSALGAPAPGEEAR